MTGDSSKDVPLSGLTEAEAAKRLAVHGANELARTQSRSAVRVVFEVMK